MRRSWISWETTATLLLLYTTYRYAVNVTSSYCNAATNPIAPPSFVTAADVGVGHTTRNIDRDQDEEQRSYQEPTQRPSRSVDPPHSTEEEEDDIILLDHHDSSPVLRGETNEEEEEDPWEAASHQPATNPTTTTTTNPTTTSHSNNTKNTTADDVIVMALVDGTLVGLSRSTGQTLWKHYSQEPSTASSSIRVVPEVSHPPQQQQQRHPLAKPLVSTTTTIGSAGSHHRHHPANPQHRPQFRNTVAVPSILDGKVYLTSTSEDCGNWEERHRLDDDDDDNADTPHRVCDLVEDTVTTTIHDLMVRTPFVDLKNHGRIYTSQRHSVAVAIHSTTGRPIRTITTSSTSSSSKPSSSPTDPLVAISETDVHDDDNANTDDILWLGRTDYTISVHEATTGDLDVQFTMAEMMSIHDMMLLENDNGSQKRDQQQQQILRQYLLPQNSIGNIDNDDMMTHRAVLSSSSSTRAAYGMIATPNGHVAYRNLYTGQIVWVAAEAFLNTPAVYAFDAKTGRSIRVDIVPDVISPHGTMEYVSNELQKQFYEQQHHQNPYGSTLGMNEPVFGAIPGTGQIYAIPLIQKVVPQQKQLQHSIPDAARAYVSGKHGTHQHYTHPYDPPQQHQPPYCHPNSPHYPRCLNHNGNHIYSGGGPDRYSPYDHHRPFRNKFPNALSDVSSIQYSEDGYDDTRAVDDDAVGSSGAIVPFYHPDYGYQYIPPDHFYTINTEWNEQYRRRKRYKKFMRTVTSWLVPTIVAALFVTSFELGRRKKFKTEKDSDSNVAVTEGHQSKHSIEAGIIQVNENVILGHGGHGTVVYKGMLEGRQVAVKRLLKTYNASADREISLLIESDGHVNVVRYHLKETRGDFVYLALELCDLSLHDLIGHIRSKLDRIGSEDGHERAKVLNATKPILLQITKGAEHLHRLRIVHRDLKPANILLASTKSQRYVKTDSTSNTVYETFARGDYIAKISDMGLGKQLTGQNSYGGSLYNESSLRGESSGVQSSIIGIGPGSVGWQAPEVMRLRMPSDISAKSDNGSPNDTGSDFSPMDVMSNNRTSRSVDIFSLGCVFYSSLIPGSHPFGEWYERESNIMHDRPNLAAIESLSLEAHDLISLMLCRDPRGRPTATQIGYHPFFWTPERRLSLLCDVSDRLEQDSISVTVSDDASFHTMLLSVEKNALKVVGTSWDRLLDSELINNVQRFRSYDPSSIRDLLRLIRNKFHHFDELPDAFKESVGSKPEGLAQYFALKFPRLLLHVFHFCQSTYACDDMISVKYAIPATRVTLTTRADSKSTTQNRTFKASNTIPEESESIVNECDHNGEKQILPPLVDENSTMPPNRGSVYIDDVSDDGALESVVINTMDSTFPADEEDIIVWAGSTSAKTLQCRGWNRSDDEWQHQSDLIARRRDANLVRCAEDPKFRTRLCNHWDDSFGTFCPMRKKNKCIFAHGPVELRVKEAKRNRWGKLVDENGGCNNERHSGGEDTYGAARSIEKERKQEGKWSTKAPNGTKGKSGASTKKNTKGASD